MLATKGSGPELVISLTLFRSVLQQQLHGQYSYQLHHHREVFAYLLPLVTRNMAQKYKNIPLQINIDAFDIFAPIQTWFNIFPDVIGSWSCNLAPFQIVCIAHWRKSRTDSIVICANKWTEPYQTRNIEMVIDDHEVAHIERFVQSSSCVCDYDAFQRMKTCRNIVTFICEVK